MNLGVSLALAAALSVIHLMARLEWVTRWMKLNWVLSGSGGIAVAYVFVHILPELNEHQDILEQSSDASWMQWAEHHAYVASMLGLVLFYGVERILHKARNKHEKQQYAQAKRIFWLHICSFTVYNGMIGYLLIERMQSKSLTNLLLYTFAMGLHFLVNDQSLREAHTGLYDQAGRWLLSGAVLLGWGLGALLQIPEGALSLVFAVLSGAILLNVLKEELPDQKDSSVWAFFGGSVLYTVLLLCSV